MGLVNDEGKGYRVWYGFWVFKGGFEGVIWVLLYGEKLVLWYRFSF